MDTFVQIILVTSFLLHALLKSLVIGGIPIMMLAFYRGRHGACQEYYLALAKGMSRVAPMTMGLAIVFGLVAWVVVRIQYDWRLSPIFSSVGGWLMLLAFVLFGFCGIVKMQRDSQADAGSHWALGSFVTCCMVAITAMFVHSHIAMLFLPTSATFDVLSIDDSTFWPRVFHAILSGLAITGMVLTIYGSLRPQSRKDHEADPAPYDIRLVRYGAGWILGGTVPQVVVGPWFMLVLPADVRLHLIDGTSVVSLIFFISVTLTLLSLVLLNSSLLVPQKRGLVWGGVGSLVLTITFMALIREEVRKIAMMSHGIETGIGELSWIVVVNVVAIMFVGLFLGGRYVTLSHDAAAQR